MSLNDIFREHDDDEQRRAEQTAKYREDEARQRSYSASRRGMTTAEITLFALAVAAALGLLLIREAPEAMQQKMRRQNDLIP